MSTPSPSPYVFQGDPVALNIAGDILVTILHATIGIAVGYFIKAVQSRAVASSKGIRVSSLDVTDPLGAFNHITAGNGSVVAWCALVSFMLAVAVQPILDAQLRFETVLAPEGEGPVGILFGTDSGEFPASILALNHEDLGFATDGWTTTLDFDSAVFESVSTTRLIDISIGVFPTPIRQADEGDVVTMNRVGLGGPFANQFHVAYHRQGKPIVGIATEFKLEGCNPSLFVRNEVTLVYTNGSSTTQNVTGNSCANGNIREPVLGRDASFVGVSAVFAQRFIPETLVLDRSDGIIPTDNCQVRIPRELRPLEDSQFANVLGRIMGRTDVEVSLINGWPGRQSTISDAIVVRHIGVRLDGVPGGSPITGFTATGLFFTLDNRECKRFIDEALIFPSEADLARFVQNASAATVPFDANAWCAVHMLVYCGFSQREESGIGSRDTHVLCKGASDLRVVVLNGITPRNSQTEKQLFTAISVGIYDTSRLVNSVQFESTRLSRSTVAAMAVSYLDYATKPYYEIKTVGRVGVGYVVTFVVLVLIPIALFAIAWKIGREFIDYPIPASAWQGYQVGLCDKIYGEDSLRDRNVEDDFAEPNKDLRFVVLPPLLQAGSKQQFGLLDITDDTQEVISSGNITPDSSVVEIGNVNYASSTAASESTQLEEEEEMEA